MRQPEATTSRTLTVTTGAGRPDTTGAAAPRGGSRPPDPVGEALVARVSDMAGSQRDHAEAVARAVEHWAPMALRIAGSFKRRTNEPEDLQQVAMTALVQAVLRYRPEVGAFPSYAVPCISGEIRRWMRDFRGLVHVPRRVVELDLQVVRAEERLAQRHGRQASPAEVGHELGVSADDVRRARAGRAARSVSTLDTSDRQAPAGRDDERLDRVEVRAALAPLLARLDERSRRVMVLRFYGERTQSEIAREIGVSQVQVSRIIRRSLDRMRQLAG